MEDIKAIDVRNAVFYVRKTKLFKPFAQHYETQVLLKTTWKGVVLKMGLKPGEEWLAQAAPLHDTTEGLIKEMDEAGVELCFMDQMKMWSWHDHKVSIDVPIDLLDEVVAESKGRIVPGGSYNPFQIKESLEELERGFKEHGFKFVWFHPCGYGLSFDDRRNYPLYAKCQELGLPVAFQTGQTAEQVPFSMGHPCNADWVALDFPDLKIILSHTGYPWVHEWISMIWKHPNVYGWINGYFPKDLDPAIVKFMDTRGRDKVMWGTNGMGYARCKGEFMELPMRDENKKKILRNNAIEVFKLNVKP